MNKIQNIEDATEIANMVFHMRVFQVVMYVTFASAWVVYGYFLYKAATLVCHE